MQMQTPIPITRDLVLLGGGHTHALVLKQWAANGLPGARLTLINPEGTAPYTGMLPGYVAGHYARDELDIDLVKLARIAGARLVLDTVTGIDTAAKQMKLAGRPDIAYDTLSINVGITSNLPEIKGFAEHGVAAKPLGPFSQEWTAFVQSVAGKAAPPHVAVLGSGVAGVELCLAMAHRLEAITDTPPKITLIDIADTPLRGIASASRKALLKALEANGIELRLGTRITEVRADGVIAQDGADMIPASFVTSAAGARPHSWLAETGLALTNGYIDVDASLRAIETPHVFAAGDCAHLTHAPRPKAGVFAVREAPVLYQNLKADLSGGQLKRFRPQKGYLKLISLGRRSALFDKFGIALKGGLIWSLKDKIDRDFMDQFDGASMVPARTALPDQIANGVREHIGDGTPPCSGCGAKVGRAPLLQGLSAEADAPPAALEDAIILEDGGRSRVLTTDNLRAVTRDPWLMAQIAATHALGDIWAMGAQPTTALATLVLPYMSDTLLARTLSEATAGAKIVFDANGAKHRGGHSSLGPEMSIGFTIEGHTEDRLITLEGASPGDLIVLTKPIGSGTILAGEMRSMVQAADYVSALDIMLRGMGPAARILAKSASAMTDVTGFGLAGHLLNLVQASSVSAALTLKDIPLMDGAEALATAGVRSSLWSSNAGIKDQMTCPESARADLLFDPQTCGGLLATLPADKAEGTLEALAKAGEPAWVIGVITGTDPYITVK